MSRFSDIIRKYLGGVAAQNTVFGPQDSHAMPPA
jgi:hypothetical protein